MRPGWLVAVLLPCLLLLIRADYYDDLGLGAGEQSTEPDIKKAYRRLTKLYHPDHNPSEEAKETYLKISRAYEVLSDPKKRKIYDMKGEAGLKQLADAQKHEERQAQNPMMRFFGGSAGQTKGQDMRLTIRVSLADVYNGREHAFDIKKQKLCRACKGSGAKEKSDVQTCPGCKGRGYTVQRMQLAPGFVQQVQHKCSVCNGKGTTAKTVCPVCQGRKVMKGADIVKVFVEQGMPEGHQLVYEMEADESPDLLPGDLIFTIHTHPHPVFTRDGDDLSMTMGITLLQSLVGFRHTFQHLDGRAVEVTRDEVTPCGFTLTLRGQGMPRHHVPSETGDLRIRFEVTFPSAVTAEQAEQLRTLLP